MRSRCPLPNVSATCQAASLLSGRRQALPLGHTLRVVTGDRGPIIAWTAGVSAAAAGLAALFAAGKAPLDHILFRILTVIGVMAFLVLMGSAIRRPPRSQALPVDETARGFAASRAGQVGHIDQMPVRWEVTDAAREAMPSGLVGDDSTAVDLLRFSGEFGEFGSAFARMSPQRMVVLGGPGAGKTTLVSKLFLDLLARNSQLGVPVSVSAVKWNVDEDIAGWIAVQLNVTHKAASRGLAEGAIFPVIEDFDELPPLLRVEAIKRINDLGPDIPLLVTSRPGAYLNAVKASLRPIRNAAVVELCPLGILDVEAYLKFNTPAGSVSRWSEVSDCLTEPDGGLLANVLANPLMLWLAREIYEGEETDPGELADESRFGDQEAIEDHLLDKLVPRKFANDDAARGGTSRWTGRQAQRWLAFLAADLDKTRSRDIAWWRLPAMASGGRLVTFAVRGVLLTAAAWYAAAWSLHHLGGWRHAIDPALVLRGPLGRHIVPLWTHLHVFLHTDRYLPTVIDRVARSIPHPLLLVELFALLIAIANGALWALFESRRPGGATGDHVSTIGIRLRDVFFAAAGVLGLTFLIAAFLTLITQAAIPRNERSGFFAWLFHASSAGVLLLAIFLWGLTSVADPLFVKRFDMSGLPSPDKALRLSRRLTLLILSWERISRLILLWLIFDPVIAVAYGAYQIVAISCRTFLGGRNTPPGAYGDARLWLACTRRMPWRIMKFLMKAERLGILRQTGGTYQFHHIHLQRRLSAQHVELSRRLTDVAIPGIRWRWRRSGRGRLDSDWQPSSAAPWTLPIWTLWFEEHAKAAKTGENGVALGSPAGDAYREGPGVVQRFDGVDGGAPWIQCYVPGYKPSVVAEPVWQALQSVGKQTVHNIGREGSVSATTALGFPVDEIIVPEATRVSLAGGSLGYGLLLRESPRESWRWAPTWEFFAQAGSAIVRSSPAMLLIGVEAVMCWAVPRLQIEDQRYRALPNILTGSDLTQAIATLPAFRPAQRLGKVRWQEREQDRRDRSLLAFVSGPDSRSLIATANVKLFGQRNATYVAASVYLVRDLPVLTAAREHVPDKSSRISFDELIGYMSAAWHTAAEILPSLVVDDPAAVPPVRVPKMIMSLGVHPDQDAPSSCDIRDLVDFSPIEMRDDRQLTNMSVKIQGPLYLSRGERTLQTQHALIYLIQHSGYDPIPRS